jgi:hypothetical protein
MFRFTIRDVLWLTVVVALGVGWLLSYRSNRRELAALRQEAITHYLDAQSATAQFFILVKHYEKAEPGSVALKKNGHVTVRIGEREYVNYQLNGKHVDLPSGWLKSP